MDIKELPSTPLNRRQVVGAALAAAVLAFTSPLKKIWPARRRASKSLLAFDAGKPESYELHKVDQRFRDVHGIWMVRHLDSFYALRVKTRDGRLTEWNEKGGFFSSSSGHRFYKTGIGYQGPQRDSMVRAAITLDSRGHLEVDPEKIFHQEKTGWTHPQSSLKFKGTVPLRAGLTADKSVILSTPGTVPVMR